MGIEGDLPEEPLGICASTMWVWLDSDVGNWRQRCFQERENTADTERFGVEKRMWALMLGQYPEYFKTAKYKHNVLTFNSVIIIRNLHVKFLYPLAF